LKQLRIANNLTLPLETVTSTLIAYGGKGMGKTNLGSVLVEELTRCGLRWAWLDPLGVSWGLRHSADGAGPGVECLILGGLHGDVPIEPAGGAAVADVVVEESTNVLVDFSRKPSGEMWSIGEKIRFVTAYALRLFQRQGEIVSGRRRDPLFQVLDEAARYIPQVIPSGAKELAESVGAWNQLVEEGRNVGVGVGLLTQRSARMAKSVSELADAMIAFRTVGPNSLAAILDWLGEHVEKERIKELASTVRSLERGHALIVSPGWLKFEGVVKIRMRETFNSSATVKHGERQRTARGEGAKPDLAKIRERMAVFVERAKAEDPRELRKTIADLRAKVAAAEKVKPAPAAPAKSSRVVEKSVLKDAHVKRLESQADRLVRTVVALQSVSHDLDQRANEIKAALAAARTGGADGAMNRSMGAGAMPRQGRGTLAEKPAPVISRSVERRLAVQRAPRAEGDAHVSGPQQKILDAAAFLEGVGVRQPNVVQLGLFAGMSATGGYWRANIGRLRTLGLIEGTSLSDAGRAVAREAEIQTVEQLHEHVLTNLLTGPQRTILRVLIDAYPDGLEAADLGQRAGLEPAGGYWRANLGRLRSLGLVSKRAPIQALPVLFLEGA
jgi:hypothetical protein